ncbi:MAG: ATP-binding protein, partial [Anaerolineae bacterium]
PIDLAEDVKSTMSVLADARDIDLTATVNNAVPNPLYGDRQRLHQILVNLTNNAIKFTNEGGVAIRIYRPDADHWGIQVADTGIGIPEDAQEYIFDPFRQVDGSATREHRGTGMGLSIVKQLVQLMGGTISLESTLGEGSTFTITLPIVNVPEEEIA